ncbi:MAG: hypothetical protein JSS14_10315 [Proteobacteria bacterium]|nr:hypothetical protein [Pseudomonadota bacterium]
MERRSTEMETVPHSLEAIPSRGKTRSPDSRSLTEIVADFFRKNGPPDAQAPAAARTPAAGPGPVPNPVLYKHWNAIRSDGISASQFIAFLQPLADLDGISVSYSYSGEDGKEHVYNRRRNDDAPGQRANPLSEAIRKGKLSKEKALTFALNEEGRVWIESNFLDLK